MKNINLISYIKNYTPLLSLYRYTINVDTGDISEEQDPKPLYVEDYRKMNIWDWIDIQE